MLRYNNNKTPIVGDLHELIGDHGSFIFSVEVRHLINISFSLAMAVLIIITLPNMHILVGFAFW